MAKLAVIQACTSCPNYDENRLPYGYCDTADRDMSRSDYYDLIPPWCPLPDAQEKKDG